MGRHDAECYRQRALEKRQRDRDRRSYYKNRAQRDLEELEAEFSKKSSERLADRARSL